MLSAVRKNEIQELFKILKINTTDEELFDEALTHPSFNFEQNIENAPDYERLEFLGDSVLRLAVSHYLFDRYSDYDEGKLTKLRSYLVSDEFLAKLAVGLGLGSYINIGRHEEKDGGRDKESILACSLEAVFGAVYKTNGYEEAKNCIYNLYCNLNLDAEEILISYNSKEILQQYTQGKNKDLPEYKVINEFGSAHDKTYEVCVLYHGNQLGSGSAKTKKEAEKIAAMNALKFLKITKGNQDE